MNKYAGSTVVGLMGVLFISGCTPNHTQTSQSVPQTPVSNVVVAPTPSTSTDWRYVGTGDFLLQGNITAVDMGSHAIKLKIHDTTPNGPLRAPTPKFPYPIGSIVTIYFMHPLPGNGTMKPVIGEVVEVWVDQYTVGTSQTSFFGSGMTNGFYFEKNGKYVNAKGEQPNILT